MFDLTASARVWTETCKQQTNIRLQGPLQLFERFIEKDSFLGVAASGSSDWQVQVALRGMPERGKNADIGVTVTSDLVGTVIDLPAPFGKRPESVRQLTIVEDQVGFEESIVRLNYSDLVEGLLVIVPGTEGFEMQKGAITVGGKKPLLPDSKQLLFSGHLDRFSLTDWQPYLNERGDASDADGGEAELPLAFDVAIDELEVLGHELGDVSLSLKSSGSRREIRVDGAAVAGDVDLTNTAAGLDSVNMTLERLALESASGEQQQADSSSDFTPASFPDMQIITKQLLYDGVDLGLFEVKAYKQPHDLYFIERVVFASDLLSARISGNWRLQRGEQLSSVDLEIKEGEMDRLMDLFGYQKNIAGGSLSGSMRIAWPGPPWAFSPPVTEGKVKLRIADGQLLEVDPGAAGRILGLLSLNTLPRRLSLDFSDLFEKGFSFDEISGSFVINDGNAYTNDLFVEGPAAKIEISGRIGLVDQDYDELVTVIPYIKTGIPLAGTLAGGPAVGAMLLVAETLLQDRLGPLNRIAQKQYSVTGPWADPVIEKLQSTTLEPEPESSFELD